MQEIQRRVPGPPESRRDHALLSNAAKETTSATTVSYRYPASTTLASWCQTRCTGRTAHGISTTTSPSWPCRQRICSATPQVWAEEAAEWGISGKFEVDFQLVRGVNALEIRAPILRGPGMDPSVATTQLPPVPPQAPMLAWYANRAGYLMAIGRPAAQVGLYHPGNSIWLGDRGCRSQHHETRLAIARAPGGLGLFRRAVAPTRCDDPGWRIQEPQRPGLPRHCSRRRSMVITRTGLDRFRSIP